MSKGHAETEDRRRNRRRAVPVRQVLATTGAWIGAGQDELMERVVERANMLTAWSRVKSNQGCAGPDGERIAELAERLRTDWPQIRQQLLEGRYRPQPVLRVEIRKPNGGTRQLGIPTVLDPLIQQALLQVLGPLYEPTFSESSFGSRPGRSTHQAVQQAQRYIDSGQRWVVDLDLERFFDRVNHDLLMSRLARRIDDKRVLGLIRRYLQAGVLCDGVVSARTEGTPQGGPLSPLLSNVLLDELDKELEARGHCFVRYADDCNVYVRSRRSGQRVMASLERFLAERLRLRVNRHKSAVGRPWTRAFLGYSVTSQRQSKASPGRYVLETLQGQAQGPVSTGPRPEPASVHYGGPHSGAPWLGQLVSP
jgi:RNA-directed DNA polymerase